MPLNIPPHPAGYYFCIIARTTYKMRNCLAVVLLIFIDFTYLLKFPSKRQILILFLGIRKANPHTPIAEAASIQYLNCLGRVQPAKCRVFPCWTLSEAISSNRWLVALTTLSSTDQKVRWLFVSLLPSIFQHQHSIKNKAKTSLSIAYWCARRPSSVEAFSEVCSNCSVTPEAQ